jgi:outer membrane protein assembly factor BamB
MTTGGFTIAREEETTVRPCLYVVDPASILYVLDAATASPRDVGPVGIANVTDIAFHGPTLYGVSFSQFLRLDPDTGSGTTIGPIGFSTNGLAVAADGTIYAGTTAGELITINPVTGGGTLVGNFGGGMTSSGDLVVDANDNLYGALNQAGTVVLARIDRTSGAAKVIGPTGLPTVYGLAFLCCHLFGTTNAGELVNINVASGAATVIGTNTLTQWGMAARPCCGC